MTPPKSGGRAIDYTKWLDARDRDDKAAFLSKCLNAEREDLGLPEAVPRLTSKAQFWKAAFGGDEKYASQKVRKWPSKDLARRREIFRISDLYGFGASAGLTEQDIVDIWGLPLEKFKSAYRDRVAKGRLVFPEPVSTEVVPYISGENPYRGLSTLGFDDAEIYKVKQKEVDEAVERLREGGAQAVLVSGNSGLGKSSFVYAGVLPRYLEGDASKFRVLRPAQYSDSDALLSLAGAIADVADPLEPTALALVDEWRGLVSRVAKSLTQASKKIKVLFIDQMEEFLTHKYTENKTLHTMFEALDRAMHDSGLRVIATVRSDFETKFDDFAFVRNARARPIIFGQMSEADYRNIICAPAERAGLNVDDVKEHLVQQATGVTHALPLLARVLERLFEERKGNRLTMEALNKKVGGFEKVISTSANEAYDVFVNNHGTDVADRVFRRVFGELIKFKLDGDPIRQVRPLKHFVAKDELEFINLLMQPKYRLIAPISKDDVQDTQIGIAHEAALFLGWDYLVAWLDDAQIHFRELAQIDYIARDWVKNKMKRLEEINSRVRDGHKAMRALGKTLESLEKETAEYLFPRDYILESLNRSVEDHSESNLGSHRNRAIMGDILLNLYADWDNTGDTRPGVQAELFKDELAWTDYFRSVAAGTVSIDNSDGTRSSDEPKEALKFDVGPFKMARWPVTQYQFRAFVSSGYRDPANWAHDPEAARRLDGMEHASFKWQGDNQPATEVGWTEAVAFCSWLTREQRKRNLISASEVIRLPTEQEWRLAARVDELDAASSRIYVRPGLPKVNCYDANLKRTVAIGLYPSGYAPNGIEELFGNVWEMCLNPFEDICSVVGEYKFVPYAAMGGSWFESFTLESLGTPFDRNRFGRSTSFGFRVVLASNTLANYCSSIK